jgi:hypothetical protein
MATDVWTPTHRIPPGGAACWATPDGATAALAARLDAGLEVRVVDGQGPWAHVECSNGWTTWVDARLLEQLAPATPPPPPEPAPPPPPPPPPPPAPAPVQSAADGFRASHVVPTAGLSAYAAHDASQPAVSTLDPSLPVQVIDRWGDWAQIACSNGWTAWVDGRYLVDANAAAVAAAPTAPVAAPAPAPYSIARRRNPLAGALLLLCTVPRGVAATPAAVGALAGLGAALVAIGSFLPLLSLNGLPAISTWDTPAAFLFSNNPDPSDFKLGILLMAGAVLALLPLLTRRALPPLLLFVCGAPATNLGIHVMTVKARTEGYPDLGPGTLMVFAGGVLIAAQAAWWLWRERRRAFQ